MMNIKFIIAGILSSFLLNSHAGTANDDCYNCRLNAWSLDMEKTQEQPPKEEESIAQTTIHTDNHIENFYKSKHCICSSKKRWAVIEGENRHSIEELENYLFQAPVFVHNELMNQKIINH